MLIKAVFFQIKNTDKNSNIVKYYNNLKSCFFILIYYKIYIFIVYKKLYYYKKTIKISFY